MSYKIILILLKLSYHKFYLIVALLPRPAKIEIVLTINHIRCNHHYTYPNLTIQYLLPAQVLILFHYTRNRPLQHQHQGSKSMETLTISLQLLRLLLYRKVLFHVVLALLQSPTLLIPTSLRIKMKITEIVRSIISTNISVSENRLYQYLYF